MIIILIVALASCNEADIKNNQAFYNAQKESIKLNLLQLDGLKLNYSAELQTNSYRNHYEAKLYFDCTKKYLEFLSEFETGIRNLKIADTLILNKYYAEKIIEAAIYTDSIKAMKELKLFPEDRKLLLFTNRSTFKLNPSGDYELLKLLYLQDFKSQILNAVNIVHPVFGCLKIRYPMFYDFVIIQNNLINNKTYCISIKNDYMYRYIEKHYFITFKTLKKVTTNDTVVVNEKITLNEDKKIYTTTAINYEKGKYLLTLNMNIELPSGLVKTDEMNFEYELK